VCPVPVTDEDVIIMLAAIDSVAVCGLKSKTASALHTNHLGL
jgi:hypothetical protein